MESMVANGSNARIVGGRPLSEGSRLAFAAASEPGSELPKRLLPLLPTCGLRTSTQETMMPRKKF